MTAPGRARQWPPWRPVAGSPRYSTSNLHYRGSSRGPAELRERGTCLIEPASGAFRRCTPRGEARRRSAVGPTAAIVRDAAAGAEFDALLEPLAGRLVDGGVHLQDTVDRIRALLRLSSGDAAVGEALAIARRTGARIVDQDAALFLPEPMGSAPKEPPAPQIAAALGISTRHCAQAPRTRLRQAARLHPHRRGRARQEDRHRRARGDRSALE